MRKIYLPLFLCFLSFCSFGINKQKLDSVIFYMDDYKTYTKVEFTYDVNGNQILSTKYHRHYTDISWIMISKIETVYDINANVISSHNYEWNNSNNQLSNESKLEVTYNSNNDRTLVVESLLDYKVNQLKFLKKAEINYDANGNKILTTYSKFDWDINQWQSDQKNEHSYNSNGKELLKISSSWDTSLNQWRNYYKAEYTYDIAGNLTEKMQYAFLQNNTWQETYKLECKYDSNAHLRTYIFSNWSSEKNKFIFNTKIDTSYNSFGEISTVLRYEWDNSTDQFKISRKKEYIYDSYHNISKEVGMLFVNNQWDTILKKKFIYDNTIEADQLVLSPRFSYGQILDADWPFSFIYDFYQNNMLKYKLLEFRDELWSSDKAIYYYSDYVASTNEIDNILNKVMIYPNPANEMVILDLSNSNTTTATIKLMNIVGEIMLVEQTNDAKHQLDLSSLPNGVYLIQVQSNNSTSTNRIVVQR